MSQGTDVTGVLGWGVRRYAWLIALFVITLGIVVPGLLERTPDRYEASAQVGPIRVLRLPNVDILPRMATDVFRIVPDSPEVKQAAGVPESQTLGADRLEMVAAQDNIIFTVVARSTSPEVARDVANVAAARFVEELNVYSQPVGSFAVSRLATEPTEPMPRLAGPLARGIGLASGLLVGLAAVVLLLMLRRPVIDVATAQQGAGGAPVLGRVTLGRRGHGAAGMTQLCHRILSPPTNLLLMVGPSSSRRERHELGGELASWLSSVRRVVYTRSREGVDRFGSASLAAATSEDELIVLEDASPVEVATRPERSLTLLVVHEGIPAASLREQAQQYLDGGSAAVVLLRRESWWAGLRRGLRHPRATRRDRRARREAARRYSNLPALDDKPEQEQTPTPPPA